MATTDTVVCEHIVRLLNTVLQSNYAKLGQVLQGSMPVFANKMFEKALITESVKDTCTFKAIIQDFKAACGCITEISAIEKHIFSFLTVLEDLGGPPSTAGLKLEGDLKVSINKEIPSLSEFLVRSKPGKSHSMPLVYITTKPNQKRYSEGHVRLHTPSIDHKSVTPDETEQILLTRQNTSNSSSSNYDNAIYSQANEEEDVKECGRDNSTEFASSTRPRPLPDPNNPIIPGTSTTESTHRTAQSLPITKDSGLPLSKHNSPDGTNNYRQLRYRDQRPIADTYNPSEPVSDTNDIRESLSCRSMSSFNSDASITSEFIDHLKKDKTEQERKREEAERKREESEKKCFEMLQSENQSLKNELARERERCGIERQKFKDKKQKLSRERKELKINQEKQEQELSSKETIINNEFEKLVLDKESIKVTRAELVQRENDLKKELVGFKLEKDAMAIERIHVAREKTEMNEDRKHKTETEKELKQLLKKCDRQQTIMAEMKEELDKIRTEHQNKLREDDITMKSKCDEIAALKEENKLLHDSREQAMNEQEKILKEKETDLTEQQEHYESLIVRERNMVKEKERTIVEKERTIVEKKCTIEEKERTIIELKKRRKENTEYCQRLKCRYQFVVMIGAVLIFILFCINLYLISIIY